MHRRPHPLHLAVPAVVFALILGMAPAGASGGGSAPAAPGKALPAADLAGLPTPVLIERAELAGALDPSTATLYMAYALVDHDRVPAAYRSETPFHGTVWIREVRDRLAAMPSGPTRAAILALMGGDPAKEGEEGLVGTGSCDVLSPLPSVNTLETEHFYIEYNEAEVNGGPDGLTIEDYVDSLEGAWKAQVDLFAWWAPPVYTPNPAPGGKYHVRISQLSPVLYGYVSSFGTHAGLVGDNPNTAWDDRDAYASCMGLNSDYAFFPGTPRRALDATTAHEFNHSIQFGVGGLDGPNSPDSVFIEGGATWMEDEAYDGSNDNYNYLWPNFQNDMGQYENSPYPYWITWRGLTERYGASVPGGGEDVMQRFWELTSRMQGSNLEAIDQALRERGTTLADAFHAYAIAVKFLRACGGGYVYPYCFEEARQYVNGDGTQSGAGETQPHGSIGAVGGSFEGSVPDNHAIDWILLPEGGRYRVTIENLAPGGAFRVSVVCDTGRKLAITALKGVAGPGERSSATFRTSGCEGRPVAVITNQAQTAANPSSSAERSYRLTTEAAARR